MIDMKELRRDFKLPMVELFETVEGEGRMAGYPTTFVRVFNCNLRCTWCDTPYSYAPEKAAFTASIEEIVEQTASYGHGVICLTGGEPLMHGLKSQALVYHLSQLPTVWDIHIETNGAINLMPFSLLRERDGSMGRTAPYRISEIIQSTNQQQQWYN